MRNMGRLFQYNRFGVNDNEANKKDNLIRNDFKTKMQQQQQQPAIKCPAYAELYATDYKPTITTTTTAMMTTTTTTPKSVELAIRKYQEWSSKFSSTTLTAATTTAKRVTHLSAPRTTATMTTTTSSSQKSSCSCSCTTSSGYHSNVALLVGVGVGVGVDAADADVGVGVDVALPENDRALLVSAVKRPRVYDCMKDFLRRKLFQQHATDVAHRQLSDTEEDVTSDYDEVDMLDSSYNADEEDATDCSSSSCSFSLEPEEVDADRSPCHQAATKSPQKSLLSLNCWHNASNCSDSTTDDEADAPQDVSVFAPLHSDDGDDSDAGISDCCQLISEKTHSAHQPRRTGKTKRRTRHCNVADSSEHELLASGWYQPHLSAKAALAQLLPTAPGSFLVRRKARAYELCLRVESKVKHFAVLAAADNYRLKGAKKQFTSLKALVTHHSVMAEQLPLTLALPREYRQRSTRALRYADDFDTYESLEILGILQDMQAHDYECS